MPRKEINYENTIIYKLACNDLSVKDVYVGHTTDFTNRKRAHKKSCIYPNMKNYNFKVYQIIRENGHWDNWSMIEIEKYPCHDNNEARARERYWYELLNANMNTNCPTFDKENLKEYGKKYRIENKEIIREKDKIYRKEYLIKNRIKVNENLRNYRQQQPPRECECGSSYQCHHKARHEKSKKHQQYLQDSMVNDE
jgi:hypothetical protein